MRVLLDVDIPDRKIRDLVCRANPGMDMKTISLTADEMRVAYEESVRFCVEHALKHIFGVVDVVLKV